MLLATDGTGLVAFTAEVCGRNAVERVVGSLAVYDPNPAYRPGDGAQPSGTAGLKVARLDRIEWHVISDESTNWHALLTDEVDWWENPTSDMLGPAEPLRRHRHPCHRSDRHDVLPALQPALAAVRQSRIRRPILLR